MTNDPGHPKSERNQERRRQIRDSLTVGSLVAGRSSCLILAGCALLLGAAAALSAAATAEAPFVADRAWTTEEGLPDNSVFSLQQTRDGYLWMGTGDGLARFDGLHFKTFEDFDVRALNRGKIISL